MGDMGVRDSDKLGFDDWDRHFAMTSAVDTTDSRAGLHFATYTILKRPPVVPVYPEWRESCSTIGEVCEICGGPDPMVYTFRLGVCPGDPAPTNARFLVHQRCFDPNEDIVWGRQGYRSGNYSRALVPFLRKGSE